MATPAPIYASSPGLLVSKNVGVTQVVLLPPVSTIAGQLIVRDASGTASAIQPIVVSTTQGALFTGGASTFYITDPYSAFATAALGPSLYMPLYAPSSQPSFRPTFRYGTESNFTPQLQYISSAYNPASFNALSSTTLQGTLINGAPLFTTAGTPFRFVVQSLSTAYTSTAQFTLDGNYAGANAMTTNSYSAYLSAGTGLFSTVAVNTMTVQGNTTLQSTLRTAGSLQIGGNFSMAGPAVFADVSANGFWSTLGTIGIGGDVSGVSFSAGSGSAGAGAGAGASTIVGGGTYSRGPFYVSAATVTASLSTTLATASTAVYSGGLGVGMVPGAALRATVDISGTALVTAALTAAGISTFTLSTAGAEVSTATLRDVAIPYSAYDVRVQGGQLRVGGITIETGVGSNAEFKGDSFTAVNSLYGISSVVSSFTVGSTIVNPDFNMAVYGSAHTSSIYGDARKSTLIVAVGNGSNFTAANYTNARLASIKYSWNGSNNWSNAVSGGFIVGQDVAWNGRMWVAVGTVRNITAASTGDPRSTIQWSLDGSNWSNCLVGGGFSGTAGGWGIGWNGRMWVASGHCDVSANMKSTIQYSFDGSNFQAVNSVNNFVDGGTTYSNVVFRPHWNGYMWFAGRSSGSNANNACYSYDGLNWSNSSISTITGPVSHMNWNGRYWIATGSALSKGTSETQTNYRTSIAISSNGFDWISTLNATFGGSCNSFGLEQGRGHCHNTLWMGDKWVAIGQNSTSCISYSFDGLNWLDVSSSPVRRNIFDQYQTGGADNQLTYYLPRTVYNTYGGGRGILWNGRFFIAVGFQDGGALQNNTIRYSPNLINWFSVPSNGFAYPGLGYSTSTSANNGNAVAWQSNCQTDISLPNQDIITSRTQQTYASTAQIYSLSSLVTFNQTLFVDSANQTAINTTFSSFSTQYLFHVDGSMLTYGAAKQGGAATWTSISDQRVKEDIQNADLSACYHAVRSLQVHNYKYKDAYVQKYRLPSKSRYGLYAEEVEEVIPEAVLNTDVLGEPVKMLNMEPVNMNHYGATAYLYSTLKHQTSTIAGGHTYITAAGPLHDISGALHTSYSGNTTLMSNLAELFAAHIGNCQ